MTGVYILLLMVTLTLAENEISRYVNYNFKPNNAN